MMVYSSSQRMASQSSATKSPSAQRPPSARVSSFSHQAGRDDGDSLRPPKRAHTFQNGSPVDKSSPLSERPDAFETADSSDTDDGIEITRASVELDVLPIELVTLTDRYVDECSELHGSYGISD